MPQSLEACSSPKLGRLAAALAAAPLAVAALSANGVGAAPAMHEITITVTHVKAIDKIDQFSKGDFYARATIGKDTQSTAVVKQQTETKPDWKIVQKVAPGKVPVKLELLDKDLAADDPIDINAVDKKRFLEFTVDTKKCRIEGFSSTQRCGAVIKRAGKELKSAEIEFKVSVKK
ncbi:MAG: hypothetical protein ACT4N2_06430 [Hyphomicrobium sp.]